MTGAGEVLAREIARQGPITFYRFMEIALYHPEHGYYRRMRDPFGKAGDFYTAEQIQPVFGILMAEFIRQLYGKMNRPRDFRVVELGAGRGEMADAFAEWTYCPVDIASGEVPAKMTGVVFANEFFDALPVDVAIYRDGAFLEQRVDCKAGTFVWQTGGPVPGSVEEYLCRHFPPPEEGRWYEVNLDALVWMERIARSLMNGYVVTIDYGYTRAESVRFPAGTLMGYSRHIARENVLEEPGERDITAHVNFTALQDAGESLGLHLEIFETLAKILLRAGEPDQFASALAGDPGTGLRRRMQLKTLLFGMGETFRVQVLAVGGGKIKSEEKG
jgi:SAM-dependent MidA family methyltransferase